MSIWKSEASIDDMTALSKNTLVTHMGIEYLEIGEDFIRASMPVDQRSVQPMGILHGGASVVLAETLGSTAANLAVEPGHYCVGLDINANHIRSARSGLVYGVTRPIHLGRTTQVWAIEIHDEQERLVCVSRLTMAVLSA